MHEKTVPKIFWQYSSAIVIIKTNILCEYSIRAFLQVCKLIIIKNCNCTLSFIRMLSIKPTHAP